MSSSGEQEAVSELESFFLSLPEHENLMPPNEIAQQ